MKFNHNNTQVDLEMWKVDQMGTSQEEFHKIHILSHYHALNVLASDDEIRAMQELVPPWKTQEDKLYHKFGVSEQSDIEYFKNFRKDAAQALFAQVEQVAIALSMFSAKERNVHFNIDKSLTKKLAKIDVSPKIFGLDLRKRFFHLSNSYCFNFGNDFSFCLSFLDRKANSKDGYAYYLGSSKNKLFSAAQDIQKFYSTQHGVDSMLSRSETTIERKNVEHFLKLRDHIYTTRKKHFVDMINKAFSRITDSVTFQFFHNDKEDGKQISSGVNLTKSMIEELFTFETFDDWDKHTESNADSTAHIDTFKWIAVCLQMLEFSHKQEFVTKNKTFTTNMRKAAKDMPRKKEKASYKELTAEKIIDLPRKVFSGYIKSKTKGNHVSPVGHDRAAHPRTYTHPRFVNMQGKTVQVKMCRVNGGATKDRKTIYKPDSKSKILKGFLKSIN